jgi:hypothetical protein
MVEILNKAFTMHFKIKLSHDSRNRPFQDFWDWLGYENEYKFRQEFRGGPGYVASYGDRAIVETPQGFRVINKDQVLDLE